MICGNIKNIREQHLLTGRLKTGLEYLLNLKPGFIIKQEKGFYEKIAIKGEDIFAMHQVYQTRSRKQAKFEAHRTHIDLQFIWKGEEIITVSETKGLITTDKYDKNKDVGFFEYKKSTDLLMIPGQLAILFPTDAHAPCLSVAKKNLVYKTVIKVRL